MSKNEPIDRRECLPFLFYPEEGDDMKATPGPWKTQEGLGQIDWEYGFARISGPRWEANARLIAAAPELLEMLGLAIQYLEHPDVLAVTDQMALPGSLVVKRVRAAIAAAEGRK